MQTLTHRITAVVLAAALAAPGLAAADPREEALEPCINGGVSANGLYPSQAQQDAAEAVRIADDADSLGSGEDDVIGAFGGNRDDFLR